MKKSILRFFTFLFMLLIWVIMNDGALGLNTIFGALVTITAIFVSGKLLGFDYADVFSLPPLRMFTYILFMIREIYVAGFRATRMIITGDINPGFVTVSLDSRIKSPYLRNLVATSITLTPGTITVDQKNGDLVVLCLHCSAEAPSPAVAFEHRMVKIQMDKDKGEIPEKER